MGVRATRLMVIASLFVLVVTAVAQEATSKPDPEYREVQGLENWTYEYDLSALKPGTYNILATAVDSAGNVSVAAPFNLIVDPESDMAIAGIVNPLPLTRVGADLNVVGTCVDDDAVDFVELKIDDSEWDHVEGSEYWSYYLRTASLADGLHVITVRGVDTNGLTGKETSVSFHLDRTKPLHTVSDPGFGAIVSGRLSISGSVYDANGLAGVSYSMDAGATWLPLRHSYDKKTNTATFTLAADTTKLPDGPTVLWLKSVDAVGSEGIAVFLYFVDNTRPELVVLSPGEDEAVNGAYAIRGRVFDTVGVSSLSWTYEKESGQVELLPGNPYFTLPFLAPAKAGATTVRISAGDVAGNMTMVAVTRRVNPGADLPVVLVTHPAAGSTLDGEIRVTGAARDDDGVVSVDWRLDSGPETRVDSTGTFSFTVPGAPSGSRVLWVRATDQNGLAGPWTQVPFTYAGAAPKLTITRGTDASGEHDFAPGLALSTLEGRAALSGTVTAANPLATLTYTVNGGAPVSLPVAKSSGVSAPAAFTVPLSASLPFGVLDVSVTATDTFGKTGSVRVPVLAINYARPRSGPLLDFGLGPESAATGPGAAAAASAEPVRVSVSDLTPLTGTFVTPFDGEAITTVQLDPPTQLLESSFEGSTVRVTRKADGTTAPTSVVVTTERGHHFSAGPFLIRTDSAAPVLNIVEPVFGSWQHGETSIVVTAQDGDAVASVEFAVNGGAWLPLNAAPVPDSGAEYRATFDSTSATGPVRLDVRAVDAAGNTAVTTTAFLADPQAPEPARLLPRDGDEVSGPTRFVVRLGESLQSLEKVELGRDGSFETLEAASVITFTAEVPAGSQASMGPLLFRVTDRAGNATELDLLAGLKISPEARTALVPAASIKTNTEWIPAGLEGPLAVFAGSDATGALSWTVPILAPLDGAPADQELFADYAAKPIRASGSATLNATFTHVAPDPKKPVAFWGYEPGAINMPLALKPLKKGATPDDDVWSAVLKLPAKPDGLSFVWVSIQDTKKGAVHALVALDYDSTPPALELVSPAPAVSPTGSPSSAAPAAIAAIKASAAGAFALVLRATDANGIASVAYESGTDKGELELQPGFGDAARTFTFAPKATSSIIKLTATDGSGNRSVTTVTVAFDAAADQPAVHILAPAENEVTAAAGDQNTSLQVLLHTTDDDALATLNLTMDATALQATGPGPLYAIDAGRLAPGKHVAVATATDAGGAVSAKASLNFMQAGAAPTVTLRSVVRSVESGGSGAPEAFTPGATLVVDGKTALSAVVSAAAGLAKIEYAINGGVWAALAAPKPDEAGTYQVRVMLPATLLYERNTVSVRATDATGVVALDTLSFYRVTPERGIESVLAEGVYLYDGRIDTEGRAVLAPGNLVGALWLGRPVSAVSLEPPLAFAEASFEGAALKITATADGGAAPDAIKTVLRVETVDGDIFSSQPLALVVDSGAPVLALTEPVSGLPVGTAFTLSGTASDTNGLAALEWSTDNGTSWKPFEATNLPSGTPEPVTYTASLTPEATDGPIGILVRATDRAGTSSTVLSAVAKDTAAPLIVFETPRTIDTVNGTILVSGYAEDAFSVASIEYSTDGTTWEPLEPTPRGAAPAEVRRVSFSRIVDLGALPEDGATLAFRATDAAGNALTARPLDPAAPAFIIDIEADKPTIQIQVPAEAEVARSDFKVSGMAFDDDGIKELYWRLDGSDWARLDSSNGFVVTFKLLDLTDNEHLFEAYAVDLNGVSGEIVPRGFRVSREEPVGNLDTPNVEIMNKNLITLKGVASDANGIAAVYVSFDNGATFNAAVGTTDWSYTLDTRTIPDGVHSIYLRLVDGYDTPGFAAGLISVDNTPPSVQLDTPLDGDEGLGSMIMGGRVSDGIAVQSMSLQISRLGASTPELVVELKSEGVFSREVDIRALPPGWYNIKAVALDKAGNAAYDSRNVLILESQKADYAELVFPAHGETVSGRFTLDGRIVSSEPLERASVQLNGQPFAVVELQAGGWFSLPVEPGTVEDGELSFTLLATSKAGVALASEPRVITYSSEGPWVDIDAVRSGDFIIGRPFLVGKAGWETPNVSADTREAIAAHKKLAAERRVIGVAVSRDNGKTWQEASGTGDFKYRLETQEYQNGALRLLVKATFANGQTAVRKRMVVLDTEKPQIHILKPAENGRYNGIVSIEGTASDTNGLTEVMVLLRSGDKSSYEVPGFIQGSYADIHVLGATVAELGLGLSFFDDNVKLQVELGKGFYLNPTWENLFGMDYEGSTASEKSRFGGYVLGARLLANLAYLPFSYWFGPDWEFFSMSFAVGASFTYFSKQNSIADILSPPNGQYMVLSGVVAQWEFAKFHFNTTFFNSIGFYLEGGLIFIPSEVSTKLEEFIRPNVAFGIRIGLF